MSKIRQQQPSRLAEAVLRIFLPDNEKHDLLGDYEEYYKEISASKGCFRANLWYWLQIVILIPTTIRNSTKWSLVMIRNYLNITLRNLKKHKFYSFINIAGLVFGLTTSLLILLYVQYELSYDRYHEKADEIYKISTELTQQNFRGSTHWRTTYSAVKSALLEEYPEVINSARIFTMGKGIVKYKDNLFTENRYFMADPEFLEIFTFPLVAGEINTALNDPFSILITEDAAKKYFGAENPIGKVLSIKYNRQDEADYQITGVLKNIPENSHLHFNFLASYRTLNSYYGHMNRNRWSSCNTHTYIQLPKGYNYKELEKKLPGLVNKYLGDSDKYIFSITPLTELHLSGNMNNEIEPNYNIEYIYLFSLIAFLIILIACFNYINLSTACYANRLKEVGIRKVLGAGKKQFVFQFFCESTLYIIVSIVISIIVVGLLLPSFSEFVDRNLSFNLFSESGIFIPLILITLFAGFISGFYPGFFLSSFHPVNILKRVITTASNKSFRFRDSLVVIQFVVSIAMIFSTIIIYQQLRFINSKDLGFDKDYIINVKISDVQLRKNYEPFKNELMNYKDIIDISVSLKPFMDIIFGNTADWDGKADDERMFVYGDFVEQNHLDFYNIKLLKGRNFSKEITTDVNQAFIINKTMAEMIGWEDPIGKRLSFWYQKGIVIGVMDDIHIFPLHARIEPMVISLIQPDDTRWQWSNLSIKINPQEIQTTTDFIKKTYKKCSPEYPFEYWFLDERVDNLYKSEQKLGRCLILFTVLAIIISCLGLIGLVTFSTERKSKEIGIRKVLGASIGHIVNMVTKEFFRKIILAALIALPVGWYIMNRWLDNFAYKIDFEIGPFITALLLSISITFASIGFKAIKAAITNPVESLRNE